MYMSGFRRQILTDADDAEAIEDPMTFELGVNGEITKAKHTDPDRNVTLRILSPRHR